MDDFMFNLLDWLFKLIVFPFVVIFVVSLPFLFGFLVYYNSEPHPTTELDNRSWSCTLKTSSSLYHPSECLQFSKGN